MSARFVALLLAFVSCTAGAQPPAGDAGAARECLACMAIRVSYDAHKAFLDSIERALETRSARVKELTGKLVEGKALTPQERQELRDKTDEMKKLDEAKGAWQPVIDRMKRTRDDCTRQCVAPAAPAGVGSVPGGAAPGAAFAASPEDPRARLPRVPLAACDKCTSAREKAREWHGAAGSAADEVADAQYSLQAMDAIDAGSEVPYVFREMTQYQAPHLRAELRESARARLDRALARFLDAMEQLNLAIGRLRECNRTCEAGATPPPPAGTGIVPGGAPMKPLGQPGGPLAPAPQGPRGPGSALPQIPEPLCEECAELWEDAQDVREELEYVGDLVAEDAAVLRDIDAAAAGRGRPGSIFNDLPAPRRAQVRESRRQNLVANETALNELARELEQLLGWLAECNRWCRSTLAPLPGARGVGVAGGRTRAQGVYPGPDFTVPEVPRALCPACQGAAQRALELRRLVQMTALVLMVARPPVPWPYVQLGRQLEALEAAIAHVHACNRLCVAVATNPTLLAVISILGVNPFDPDNPIGTAGGGTQPPPAAGPGTVQFSASSYSGTEGTAVTVTVLRVGGRSGPATVGYIASDRTANAGADFVPVQGTLSWADGDASPRTFTVPLVDDSVLEQTELVELTLLNPTGVAFSEPSRATISILDNDAPAPAQTLQLSSASYQTAEGQGQVTITVTRSGGAAGAVSVGYITVSGTASGADFGGTSGRLSWADGDASAKSFTVSITDDTQVEGSETFGVQLSNPAGATLGSPATATVTIADNDAQTGCGPWQPGTYACSGNCDPCPTPQRLTIEGQRITVSPFHAGGAATFTGCMSPVASDSNTLVYFGQANHRATLTSSGNGYRADIQSSGGGTCFMTCIRTGP